MSRVLRAVLTVIGLLACAVAGVALLARYVPVTNHVLVVATVCCPLMTLVALLAVALFVPVKRYILAGVAVVLTAAMLAVQLPVYVGTRTEEGEHIDVRVLSANLNRGQADPQSLVRSARDLADVVAVQELTPGELGRLSAAGMDTSFPYRLADPKAIASGAALWSRYPLQEISRGGAYLLSLITARMRIQGVSIAPTISVVHAPAPWPWPVSVWRNSLATLAPILEHMADSAGAGAVVVAGDLNSTRDMLDFRQLLRDGYQDADEQDGAGLLFTFPADLLVPPLISIDHVLTRGCRASSVRTLRIVGSDHRALLTDVEIARLPSPDPSATNVSGHRRDNERIDE